MAGKRLEHEVLFGRFVVHQPHHDAGSPFLQVRVRDLLTGRTRKRSTRTTSRRAARQFVIDWLSSVVARDAAAVDRETFDNAVDEWLAQQEIRESTRYDMQVSIKSVYRPAFKGRAVCDISGADVQDFLADLLRRGRSWKTRRKHLKALRAFFGWAIVRGLAETNPTDRISVPQGEKFEGRALSSEEARSLLGTIRQAPLRRHTFLATLIAVHTGLRRGNVLGLEWSQLDLEARRLDLPASQMKSKRRHSMPLHGELVQVLKEERDRKTHARVIGLELRTLGRSFPAATRDCDLGPLRFHDLRHSFATWLRQHSPEDVVARLLGHSTRSITSTYIHREWKDLEEAIDRLPNLLSTEPGT